MPIDIAATVQQIWPIALGFIIIVIGAAGLIVKTATGGYSRALDTVFRLIDDVRAVNKELRDEADESRARELARVEKMANREMEFRDNLALINQQRDERQFKIDEMAKRIDDLETQVKGIPELEKSLIKEQALRELAEQARILAEGQLIEARDQFTRLLEKERAGFKIEIDSLNLQLNQLQVQFDKLKAQFDRRDTRDNSPSNGTDTNSEEKKIA